MAFKNIKCPWCGKEARITYEENRVYQMKCYSCRNTMLHVDHSFDSAVEFFEHQANLLQAEQDGRLVVLPCKVGDKVRVDARTWGDTWNYKTVDGGKYLLGEIVAIIKTRKQILIKIRVEHNVSWKSPMRRYPISAIGKTVFLTREDEEAALKGGEG